MNRRTILVGIMELRTTLNREEPPGGVGSQSQNGRERSLLSRVKNRVIILGSGQLARKLSIVLKEKRTSFCHVVGYVDNEQGTTSRLMSGDAFLGSAWKISEIVDLHQVDTIVVCVEDRRTTLPVEQLLDLKTMGTEVVDGHQLYEKESGRLSIDSLRPSALIFSSGFRRRSLTMRLKRAMDVLVATISLAILSPLLVLIGAAIKLDSPGPIFYRQTRVGLRSVPYVMWKFRSMRNDAEKNGPRWAQVDDPRVSTVGRWLRKTRLDEIPQFINVLKGEMSLVGPRPERPIFVQELREKIPYYDIRHTVRPGITGWAQTRFRYGASAEDTHTKLQYDLFYVKNMTLALDTRILVETIRVILLGEGAR